MDRDQILRVLGERETVGRAEVARLEEEAARITVLIEQCQREVDRLASAREVLSGLAEELPTRATYRTAGARRLGRHRIQVST